MKPSLYQYSLAGLETLVAERGWKKYITRQLVQWLYQKKVSSFAEMSDLSKEIRAQLEKDFSIDPLHVVEKQSSTDGTTKFLFNLSDDKKIEAVFIPSEKRTTLCLSTQVGCAMACTFCRTGEMKLQRNLTLEEIVGQVLVVARSFPSITNLVFMGMGEPMANLPTLLDALAILKHPNGCGFSKNKITVSTSGVVPKMYEFVKQSEVKLAVSLHAPNDALRTQLMPINKRYPLKDLMQFCREYRGHNRRHRITFEYVMLKGVNDSLVQCKELVRLLEGVPSKINLIPFNPFPGNDFHPSPEETIKEWVDQLMRAGIQTNVRKDRGRDILAACGQLAYLNLMTTSPSRM